MATDFLSPASPLGSSAASAPRRFSWDDSTQRYAFFTVVGLTALLTYSYWNTLETTSAFWSDAQYSHGWIVPLIALYLMWSRRPNPVAHEPPEGGTEETFMGLVPASVFAKAVSGLGVALMLGGWLVVGSDLMQAVGLTVMCIGVMAYVLIGQPFEEVGGFERYLGLAVLLAAFALRIFIGAEYEMEPVSRMSFLAALLGAFLMVGGWTLLGWAGPAIGFLFFMFPLPSGLQGMLLGTLQKLASVASEIILTILGQPVIREGNKIIVDGIPLEVAEACSGLRMVTIFGAMAVAVMLVSRNRPWWDRFIILLSAIPIALVVNITRIVVTALLYRMFPEGEVIHKLIHDYAGLAMMPLAMGLLYLELKVLSMLSVEEESLDLRQGGGAAGMGMTPVAR